MIWLLIKFKFVTLLSKIRINAIVAQELDFQSKILEVLLSIVARDLGKSRMAAFQLLDTFFREIKLMIDCLEPAGEKLSALRLQSLIDENAHYKENILNTLHFIVKNKKALVYSELRLSPEITEELHKSDKFETWKILDLLTQRTESYQRNNVMDS